jgi:hypothetical protein
MRKSLVLKKETLARLSGDDLRAVVGAFPTGTGPGEPSQLIACNGTGLYLTLPLDGCIHH